MNHLPDGRWQFVLELPNADGRRSYQLESAEALDLKLEQDTPRSRATWIVAAARVHTGEPFHLKLWADGDDFPIHVHFPKDGKDTSLVGPTTLVILAGSIRR